MDHSSSMLSSLNQLIDFVELLKVNVITLDRPNIVRSCSHIQYCLSDILDQVLPDGVTITIK